MASGARLAPPQPSATVAGLPSQPYAVVISGQWAFATEPGDGNPGTGRISVLHLDGSGSPILVRTVAVPGEPFGAVLASQGKDLLVANYLGG